MTSPYSIYIPIGIVYTDYLAEYFAAYIDSGAGTCLCKPECYPKQYHQKLPPIKGLDISNNVIELNEGILHPIILISHYLIKCPPFYFYKSGTDILLGNNFLQLFNTVTFNKVTFQVQFTTPCNHTITVNRFHKAFAKHTPISFKPRTAQRGVGYKEKPHFPKGSPLLKYHIMIKQLDTTIETIKTKLARNFNDNPLQFWEKNKLEAKLEMKDKDKIIRVKPMVYNLEDKEEFQNQITELLKAGFIRPSQSSHSSPAFMVRNHAEQIRGKARMVINYKKLNDNTIFDGYFLPHKESLINWTKEKSYFSKFDCKSGFWQIKMHPDSITYTAFSTPQGQYEWLVMPFGLKNAPQIFQRKMDNIFKFYKFIFVYVDDILILSDSVTEHLKHLDIFADLCYTNGLALSEKK